MRHALLSLCVLSLTLLAGCDELFGSLIDDDPDATEGNGTGDGGADSGSGGDTDTGGGSNSTPLDEDAGMPEEGASEIPLRFELDGEGFYRLPWPFDYRTTPGGYADLSELRARAAGSVSFFASRVEAMVRGSSLVPIIYVGLGGDPIPNTRIHPSDTLFPDGPIQLVNVSAAGCGERIPVEVKVNHRADRYIDDNVLVVSTVPGFVLQRGTPYAMIVLRSLGAEDGFTLTPSEDVQAALQASSGDERLDQAFAPLARCLPELGFSAQAIAVATVFTTQDPVTEMRALRNEVANPDWTPAPTITWNGYSDEHSRESRRVYRGSYETPIFQDGVSPYTAAGGLIHFDDDGRPIRQRWERVPFTIVAPGESKPAPYRLAIWVDGTGAGDTSWVGSSVTRAMLDAGFIVAGYTAQFHGSRATPGANAELSSFNVANPDSFRNTFRQQVADTAYFVRVITEGRAQMTGLPGVDDSRIVYAGQSQGSMIGTMVAAVEPRIEAYMLNGVAAYLAITATVRTDPFDFPDLITRFTQIPKGFDHTHPFLALLQMGADASDPHSFADQWLGWEQNPDGSDVLLVNGLEDYTAAVEGMSAITIAGDAAPAAPPGWNPDPFGVWDRRPEALPLSNNRVATDGTPRTIAAIMDGTTGHFTIYDRQDTRTRAIEFLRSAANGRATLNAAQ